MTAPKIKLNGKEFRARPPKTKLWRILVKFNQNFAKANIAESEEAFEEMLNIICAAFGDDNITPDRLENELDLSDLIPLFVNISSWISTIMSEKVEKFPNSTTPTEN